MSRVMQSQRSARSRMPRYAIDDHRDIDASQTTHQAATAPENQFNTPDHTAVTTVSEVVSRELNVKDAKLTVACTDLPTTPTVIACSAMHTSVCGVRPRASVKDVKMLVGCSQPSIEIRCTCNLRTCSLPVCRNDAVPEDPLDHLHRRRGPSLQRRCPLPACCPQQ